TREQSIDLIVQACLDNDVTDTRQIAYVLATAQHESSNFRSPEEDWGRKQAVTLAYHGGEAYYGRGYAHLTHHENYRNMGDRLGLGDALVVTPQRAAEPEIATRVLVIGMREGRFTPGHTLDRYINAGEADYSGARAIINSRDTATAEPIANLARQWEAEVPALFHGSCAMKPGPAPGPTNREGGKSHERPRSRSPRTAAPRHAL